MSYYERLGVERTATPDEIKTAYYKKAKELHPDTGGGGEEVFKEISEAYQCLKDPEARAYYDLHGKEQKQRPRDLVTEKVVGMLLQVLNDPPSQFRKYLRDQKEFAIKQVKAHEQEIRKKRKKLDALKARIKFEPEGGMLSDMIEAELLRGERFIENLQREQNAHLEAISIVAQYVLEDAPTDMNVGGMSFMSGAFADIFK